LSGELNVLDELEAALKFCLLSGSRRRGHLMMHGMHMVMMMMMMVVMMVVMVHWRGHRSSRRSVLRHGVAGEAKRENGRGRKGLDHGRSFLWLANPDGSARLIATAV
jgi:hypothetical protein